MAKKKNRKAPVHRIGTHRKTAGKKRRKARSKKGLSEMISHQGIKKTAKAYGGGAIGGGISGAIDTFLPEDMNPLLRIGVHAVGALIAGAGLDKPNISAGMGGAQAYKLTLELGQKMLSEMEDVDYADDDSLENYPDAMDENGKPMYLADDGQFYYLEEFQLSDGYQLLNGYQLSESFQSPEMYPRYVNSSQY